MNRNSEKMFRFQLILALSLYTLSAVSSVDSVSISNVTSLNLTLSYLQRTHSALSGALHFFQRQFTDINLDAVIGTRIVEGSLKILLKILDDSARAKLLPAELMSKIVALYHLAKDVSDSAEPYIAKYEPAYYERIGSTIREGLWEVDYPWRRLPLPVSLWAYKKQEAMTETDSDDCLTELFGTGTASKRCAISDKCWKQMTSPGYSQYSLTHEIFYLQIGEQSGCLPSMIRMIVLNSQGSLQRLQDTFCANILHEAYGIADANFPDRHKDLFMEQVALCGLYGYYEFLLSDWLDKILEWQDTQKGCYKSPEWPFNNAESEASARRVKREELRLADDCLCHLTTVAAAALVQYFRYLVELYTDLVASQAQ